MKAHEISLAVSRGIKATKQGAIAFSCREEPPVDLFAEQALWPHIIVGFREAYNVLSAAGCSDEALIHELYLSGEPAEVFEAAPGEGFFQATETSFECSQYGQLTTALRTDGNDVRSRFEKVLHGRIISGDFMKEFQGIKVDLGKKGNDNPIERLYAESAKSGLAVAETNVFERVGNKQG